MRTFEKLMILLSVFLLLITFAAAKKPTHYTADMTECNASDPPDCYFGYPCGYDPIIWGYTFCLGGYCEDYCLDSILLDECYNPEVSLDV